MRNAEFNDPRLVEIYDAEYSWSRDDDFFLSVVNETPGSRVIDLGCGTGRLAIGMARAGHRVVGLDPAAASIERARTKTDSETVTWIRGSASVLPHGAFDTAVMTSHVAQFVTNDRAWGDLLSNVLRALVPGGRLAFDSRDPSAEIWRRWNHAESRRTVQLDGGNAVTVWTDVTSVYDELVDAVRHYRFSRGGELTSEMTLRFRPEADLRRSLSDAGFKIEHVFGGWQREPVGRGDGELLFIARKPLACSERRGS